MNVNQIIGRLWLPSLAFLLFITAVVFRPLFPIDETRYMSVAWEMSLHNGWLDPLTKNFEPYHHKPPLLFWLINAFWSVFGISRWAGTLPVIIGSLCSIYLTAKLGKEISKNNSESPLQESQRLWIIMAASLPFLVYGTLVMFDFLLTVFVLLGLILTVRYAQTRQFKYIIFLGLCLGVGVLTKGPVAYLYVLPAYLLAPFWQANMIHLKSWYISCLMAILISALPVLVWLIPVLKASDNQFAFWLVWNQTAGRITGNFGESHVRPFYFYLMLSPLFAMPWIFAPSFWKSLPTIKQKFRTNFELRFIACFFLPVFLAFSVISGKQLHYMVPLVPAIVLFLTYALEHTKIRALTFVLTTMVLFIVGGQIIASQSIFKKYDLTPIIGYIHDHREYQLGYVSNYHAEFGFLAQITKKIDDVRKEDITAWFNTHPNGLLIMKYNNKTEVEKYNILFDMPYRGRHMVVIKRK